MGRKVIDRSGQVFGLVTVERRAGTDKDGYPTWTVLCECGQGRITRVDSFRRFPPKTHIACSKAKWAEREKAILAERERR